MINIFDIDHTQVEILLVIFLSTNNQEIQFLKSLTCI